MFLIVIVSIVMYPSHKIYYIFQFISFIETTYFQPRTQVWTPSGNPLDGGDDFVLDIDINVPEQQLLYRPGVFETLKFAWIQYISVLIPFYFVLNWIKQFVFRYQMIETRVNVPDFVSAKGNKYKTS